MNRLWIKRGTVILAIALFIGLGVSTVYRAAYSTVRRTDYTVYTAAGQAVLDGTDIYDAHNTRGWYYMYLPVFAVVMVPLAVLPPDMSALLWYVLSVAMLAHAVHISVRLARRFFPDQRFDVFWLYTIATLLVLLPSMSGIARGQASLLVMYLVTLSAWLYIERRPWLAGLCLAGSVVLKVFPALLLIYFVAKRRFWMATTTAAWLIVMVFIAPSAVFGVRGNIDLIRRWVTTIALPANQPDQAGQNARYNQMINPRLDRNQSVQAVMIRWFAGGTTHTAVPAHEIVAKRVAYTINVLLLAITAWACRRWRADPDKQRTLLELCAVILLMLFLSPVSWSHNYTAAVLPLTIAVAAWRCGSDSFKIGLLVYFVGYLGALVLHPLRIVGGLLFGTVAIWAVFVMALARDGDISVRPGHDNALNGRCAG